MNSLCNETVKRYISSVVINLSASLLSTMAAQYCAKVRDRVYKESCCKLLGLLETECVKGEVQLVSEGKLPATLALYASPLGTPKDRPALETTPMKADTTFCTLGNFLQWLWSTEQVEERDEELNAFLRTEEITSTV